VSRVPIVVPLAIARAPDLRDRAGLGVLDAGRNVEVGGNPSAFRKDDGDATDQARAARAVDAIS
jgi:hypothetical protein